MFHAYTDLFACGVGTAITDPLVGLGPGKTGLTEGAGDGTGLGTALSETITGLWVTLAEGLLGLGAAK